VLLSVLIWLSASTGIRVEIADREAPALRIAIPGRPASDPGILVIFPEHVTARWHGESEARHLYLYRSDGLHPLWRIRGRVLEYTAILAPGLTMTVRATLEPDGVRFHYQFSNRSHIDYDMMQAVTDPRMISPYFHDVRLERTWVHHRDGFDLLASETPSRATMPSHAQSTSHSSRLSRPTSNGSSPRSRAIREISGPIRS